MRKPTDMELARKALEKHAGIKGVTVNYGDRAVARLARRVGHNEGMVEALRWVREPWYPKPGVRSMSEIDAKLKELGEDDG